MSLKAPQIGQRLPSPSPAHSPTRRAEETFRKSPRTSPSLSFLDSRPTEKERKLHIDDSSTNSVRDVEEAADRSGKSSIDIKESDFNFSWDDLCFYLYGHLKKEAVTIRHVGDQMRGWKRPGDEGDLSMELAGKWKRRRPSSPPLPALVFPDEVKLCTSSVPGAGLGVCAARSIPLGTWIGPYEGELVRRDEITDDTDTKYMWEIYKDRKFSHYIDGKDKRLASWMRFIKCARYKEEQNMTMFQYCGNVYYRAFKAIPVGAELLVWYDEKYSEFIDIPALLKERESTSETKGDPRSFKQQEDAETDTKVTYDQTREREGMELDEPSAGHDRFKFELRENIDPNVWKCGQCSQTFTQRVLLQMHVCTQTPEKPYQCGHCPASFQGPNDLREHVVIHVNEKPFKCGFCGRSFAGATTLNNHIRTHTGEKPFKCNKCLRHFSQSTQLSRHQKSPEECSKGS